MPIPASQCPLPRNPRVLLIIFSPHATCNSSADLLNLASEAGHVPVRFFPRLKPRPDPMQSDLHSLLTGKIYFLLYFLTYHSTCEQVSLKKGIHSHGNLSTLRGIHHRYSNGTSIPRQLNCRTPCFFQTLLQATLPCSASLAAVHISVSSRVQGTQSPLQSLMSYSSCSFCLPLTQPSERALLATLSKLGSLDILCPHNSQLSCFPLSWFLKICLMLPKKLCVACVKSI